MQRSLPKEVVTFIEHCINRGNSAVVKVEQGRIVVLEEKRKLVGKENNSTEFSK
jgi:3-phosphoglycerate kinase